MIYGGLGADLIEGNDGDDEIYGEQGDDVLFGQAGEDEIYGGTEHDLIVGGTENDLLSGGAGRDVLEGNEGDDAIHGDDDYDVLRGGEGTDSLWGDAGEDELYGDGGSDTLRGGDDDDILRGGSGGDTLLGDAGQDRLYGEADVDTLRGGTGDDLLDAGTGVGDQLFGDAGNDRIFGSDEGQAIDPDFADTVYFGDYIEGGLGDDSIWALGGADLILAGPGDDRVDAGAHADRIEGGDGADEIFVGTGTGDRAYGEGGDDLLYGSHEGDDFLSGGEGSDRLYGQGGGDVLEGDAGDDLLDGGGDADILRGGTGDDDLRGGGGDGDQLLGGDGDDVLRGSDDGADFLHGEAGRDVIWAFAGNDTITAGDGDDVIHGGPGDDTIWGEGGSDLILGEGDHDVLYGHSPGGGDDDAAVDYLYGDFGTDANEPGSGRDKLYGNLGNDVIFGEGEDDFIDPGASGGDLVFFGQGESGSPNDFVPPNATPSPTVQPAQPLFVAAASLPQGPDHGGRWIELAGSATAGGLSGDPTLSLEPAVVSSSTASYAAWVDARSGNYEIFVAKHTAADGWQQLGGSAEQGGISLSTASSRRPAIALDAAGQPIVAWTEFSSAGSDIRALVWDDAASQWTGLGNSTAAGGISQSGQADHARIVLTPLGPVVAWLDAAGGPTNVLARRFHGTDWSDIAGSSVGEGVSASTSDVEAFALAAEGNQIAVAWTQPSAATSEIFLKEFSGTTWVELAGSATGGGVSNTARTSVAPALAYHQGQLFVAWQQHVAGFDVAQAIYARRYAAGVWQEAGAGSADGFGVGGHRGDAARPNLAAGADAFYIVWSDNRATTQTEIGNQLYALRWNGTSFAEEAPGDASADGISVDTAASTNLAVAVDPSGRPWVAWQENGFESSEIYLEAQLRQNSGVTLIADPQTSVQQLLDQNVLGSGDQILVTSGQAQGFTVSPDDSGVLIYAAPGVAVSGAVVIDGADGVILQRLQISGGLTVSDASGTLIRENVVGGTLALDADADTLVVGNTFLDDVSIAGGSTRAVLLYNRIGDGLGLTGSGAVDLLIERNTIVSGGIELAAVSSGNITANEIRGTTGLHIAAAFTGMIEANQIHDAVVGVQYDAPAMLAGNRIHGNDIGVQTTVADLTSAFGGVGDSTPNDIFGNNIGVQLDDGRVLNQRIYDNATIGITGAGIAGGDDPATMNWIARHEVGVDITGDVQFNRITDNTTAIRASSGSLVAHNILDANTDVGLLLDGSAEVSVIHNTIVAESGINVRLTDGASEIELRNNILSSDAGVVIDVADDSQSGFFSDYNALYAGPGGTLVHWLFDFTDILDWQEDVHRYDLHSIGSTVINPDWSKPRFVSVATGDYRVFEIAAGQRLASPHVDSADPVVHLAAEWPFANLLTNPNFTAGLVGWTANPGASTGTPASTSFDGTPYFVPGAVEVGTAMQTVDLLAAGFSAAELDAQDLVAVFGGRIRAGSDTTADLGQIRLVFLDAAATEVGEDLVEAVAAQDRWELVGRRVPLPASTRFIQFEFVATRNSGLSNDSFLDDARLYLQPETFAPDQGAYGNVATDVAETATTHIALRTPDVYVDWERDLPHTILWDTYANADNLPVQIDLYQDGPQGPSLFRNLVTATPDSGRFEWTPANDNVDYGTHDLRVHVSLVGSPIVMDRSEEGFSVPENTLTFYANDQDTTNDEYTSAVGDNRNTGKTPDAPKPYPSNLIRIYSLGPTHSLYLDSGVFYAFDPIVLSGRGDVGDDEGFVFTGPTGPAGVASIHHAHPATVAPVIELFDADNVTLAHLDLSHEQYGIRAHTGSENLVAAHLRIVGNALGGIRLEDSSTAASFDHLQVESNGGCGIYVDADVGMVSDSSVQFNAAGGIQIQGGLGQLLNSTVSENYGDGIHVSTTTPSVVEGNTVSSNAGTGVYLYVTSTVGTAVVGNADLSLGHGNRVTDNSDSGVYVSGNAMVVGNTVTGHYGANDAGIYVASWAEARQNVVRGNYYGIYARYGQANENRVYDNQVGIWLQYDSDARGNQVYSNSVGINAASSSGQIENNLVYANTNHGIVLQYAGNGVTNNTVYQQVGDAVRVESGSVDVRLRNNILWVESGAAIAVSADSQQGFDSDFNLLYATGSGQIGAWQGIDRAELRDWRNAAFTDFNSFSQDPRFVDRRGGDGLLGYVDADHDGRDDDFHLMSRHGRFTGSFAPVLDAATGLPVLLTSSERIDALQSAAIDRGDDAYVYVNEPAPNGSFVNLGGYGNTVQASKSPLEYVLVTSPDGGEVWPAEQTFGIKWRSELFSPSVLVDIELVRDGDAAFHYAIAAASENDGTFSWTIPHDTVQIPAANDYRIRVTRTDNGTLTDLSSFPFAITAPITEYFVNLAGDSDFTDNQYTSAAGNDANDGLSGATPESVDSSRPGRLRSGSGRRDPGRRG